ncbi:MAG TPA: zinc-dependent metalloprotease, partial [Ilumatobacteraceae bacterium]
MPAPVSPIDWRRAEQVAIRLANRHPGPAADGAFLERNVEARVLQLEDQIEAATGLCSVSGPAHITVIDRQAWIRANIATFRHLLTPLLEEWSAKMPP